MLKNINFKQQQQNVLNNCLPRVIKFIQRYGGSSQYGSIYFQRPANLCIEKMQMKKSSDGFFYDILKKKFAFATCTQGNKVKQTAKKNKIQFIQT